jgi:hypothetical protein
MSPIRAEPCDATPLPVPSVQLDHEATLHAGYAVYSMLGGDHTVFAGPKLTLESGQTCGWMRVSGSSSDRADGSQTKTPAFSYPAMPSSRSWASSSRLPGTLARLHMRSSSQVRWRSSPPVGAAALFRAGGGAKVFVSDRVALGLEITGALGFGKFELHFQAAQRVALNVDMSLGIETRF